MSAPTRSNLVLGTAGHIDHGKTALVRALTGQDTDRLPEEKARGITIELGFATLELASGARLAVVDVPGHERFVRTMVAGASGLDLVLLVVAADEGVMPQTREHLAICELLGLTRGLVVLNKCDQADAEMRALAEEEVRDLLRPGPFADAPILAASARTGEGIDAVRAAIEALVEEVSGGGVEARVEGGVAGSVASAVEGRPGRADDERPARLFVDRVFEKHGFGTIATGTWSGRSLETGRSVSVEPGGRRARIRGLERHGEAVAAAESGARIAVNLQGLALDQVARGDLVCEEGALLASTLFDAELHWLASERFLEEATSVELLVGTTERRARIAPIGADPIGPGERGFVRIHVEGEPLHLLPGDRFVVRGFAREAGVGATQGGGRILDVDPPHRRRSDPKLAAELERLARSDRGELGRHGDSVGHGSHDSHGLQEEALLVRIERAGLVGTTRSRLARETGFAAGALDAALDRLAAGGTEGHTIVRLGAERCLSAAAAARLSATLRVILDEFHVKDPLAAGMPRATLAGRLPDNVPSEVASALIAREAATGWLVVDEQLVRRADFRSSLDPEQERLAKALLRRIEDAGLEAPALRSLAEALGADPARLRALAHHLERQGELVAAPEELFFARASVDALIARVLEHFAHSPELDTQTLKTLIGASRRTAMPLMALLDDLQITRRDGSIRRLLHREPRFPRGRSD
ncbi:MAG: SelB C-terminal domain-containing protein [Deltaproteobacteria bacterium]|nr:SelB C-terminal domain-containing protein [Deltaproteobacteria bacterium]